MATNPYKDLLRMINKTTKAQTLGEQFVADIDRYFQLSKEVYVPSRTIKPSSLGGCMRQQWLILIGADMDVGKLEDANMVTIQQSGNDRHKRLQFACQDAHNFGVDLEWLDPAKEVEKANSMGIKTHIKRRDGYELLCYNEDYNTSFKCDGIINYKSTKMILEIKTEDMYKWDARVTVEPKHEFQAYLYALCFGIYHVMFLYEDRNLTRRKAYHVEVEQAQLAPVKERIHTILDYKNKNVAPPKETNKCTYCNYHQACKKY